MGLSKRVAPFLFPIIIDIADRQHLKTVGLVGGLGLAPSARRGGLANSDL